MSFSIWEHLVELSIRTRSEFILDGRGLFLLFLAMVATLCLFLFVSTELISALVGAARARGSQSALYKAIPRIISFLQIAVIVLAVTEAVLMVSLWVAIDFAHVVLTFPINPPGLGVPINQYLIQIVGVAGLTVILIGCMYGAFALGQLPKLTRQVSQAMVIGTACAAVLGSLAFIIGHQACTLIACWIGFSKTPSGYVLIFALYGFIYGAQLGFTAPLSEVRPPVLSLQAGVRDAVAAFLFTSGCNYLFATSGNLGQAIALAAVTAPLFAIVSSFAPYVGWHVRSMSRFDAGRATLGLVTLGMLLVVLQYFLSLAPA